MTPISTKPGDVRVAERDARRAAVAARVKLNAWVLAGLVIAFYAGYIAWNFLRGGVG